METFKLLNRSLKARFIVFLTLILTIAIGVSSYIHLRIQYNQLMDVSRERLMDVAETIEKSLKTFMLNGWSNEVRNIIETVGTLPEFEKVRIFSKEGIVLISSLPEEKGRKVDAQELKNFHKQNFKTTFDQKNFEQPVFYIIKPILNQPPCFRCHGPVLNQINGVLEVEVSMRKFHERISTVRKSMMTSVLVTMLVLTISIVFLLSYLVNRPIKSLVTTMRKAEKGDLTARVKPDDTLEFGELGRNFNSMISKLEKAQKDLKRLHEQRMQRADRLATLGELSAGIAHEIKNPIAGISGAMQILMGDLPENDHRREIFEEILKQIDRIDQNIKDLLSYAKTAKPALQQQNINNVIRQVVFLIQERAAQKGIEVVTELDETIPKIEIDEKQIQQVLVNLGLNGIQAMPSGGVLRIFSKHWYSPNKEHFVEIWVKDSGRGISPQDMSRIFTPFFTTRHTGTGLGLSISQKIIHQHHGKIEVNSRLGEGTCFTILLSVTKGNNEAI